MIKEILFGKNLDCYLKAAACKSSMASVLGVLDPTSSFNLCKLSPNSQGLNVWLLTTSAKYSAAIAEWSLVA